MSQAQYSVGVGSMKPTKTPVKVLYVLGFGRSGSTILDIVLGNHPGIESVGEVANLPYSGWVGGEVTRSPYCSCGRRVPECPFWTDVRREWSERIGEQHDPGDYRALQDAFERYRRLPRLFLERLRASPEYRKYVLYNRALFESIRAVSGKEVVVDSSKNPLRAFALSATPGLELRAVHLVRDGRGVVSSRRKAFRKDERAGLPREIQAHPVWSTAALWVALNLLSELLSRRLKPGRAARVRYEDFVEEPRPALEKVGRTVGLDLSGLAEKIASGDAFEVGHNIGGNRVRMTESIRLRPNAGEWRGTLSPREETLTWLLAGWLVRRYGYRK